MRVAFLALVAALSGVALAAGPPSRTPFLKNLLHGKPQLTDEQAAHLAGAWAQTGIEYLDGRDLDLAVMAAIEEGGSQDYTKVLTGATRGISFDVTAWIPAVDPRTGMAAVYYIYTKDGEVFNSARHMGVALGEPDGSVLLTLTSNVDTGVISALMQPDGKRMVGLLLESVEVVDHNVTTAREGVLASDLSDAARVLDNHAVVTVEYSKMPDDEVEALQEQVAEQLGKYWKTA